MLSRTYIVQGTYQDSLLRIKRSPGKALETIPQSCTAHLAPTPRPAPNSCDYPKHWSILSLHGDVKNLIWQDFLLASPSKEDFSFCLPGELRPAAGSLLSNIQWPRADAQLPRCALGGWNRGHFDELCDFSPNNFTQTDPFWKVLAAGF